MKKFMRWFRKVGLTNLAYLALFAVAFLAKSRFMAGGFLGIFLYINFNAITKVIKGKSWKEKA